MKDFLTEVDVKAIHKILVACYGGIETTREQGGIASAVYRPQCGYYEGIVEKAAALLESLLINHPFVDGNKRTAFAAADVFLRINGYKITGPPLQLYVYIMGWITVEPRQRLKTITDDLRLMVVKLKP